MVVVEPVVTEEKLHSLLAEGHESERLDYKSTLSLDPKGNLGTPSLVELAKDVSAMQVDGGFIVIGADNQGKPTGQIPIAFDDAQKCFDEAQLHARLKKWIPEPFELHACVHQVNSNVLALIFVAPRIEGFCIFCATGDPGSGIPVFRKGDVYVRHGTASEAWQEHDIKRIFDRIIQQRKEEWRREWSDTVKAITVASQAQTLARGPANSLTWQLDEATFGNVVLEMLRANDDIALHLFVYNALLDAGQFVAEEGKSNDLLTVLDRLTCLIAVGIRFDRPQWRDEGIQAVARIYNSGFNKHAPTKQLKNMDEPELWLEVIERVTALGALCVRLGRWDGVRALVLQPRQNDGPVQYVSWLRHGFTMAAIAGTTKGNHSLVELGRVQTASHSYLRPDVGLHDESVLNSLCQFDFLSGITAIGDTQHENGTPFYPSFAFYHARRTEPMVLRLITDSTMRKLLFPYDDSRLASALRAMIQEAGGPPFVFGVWEGFRDKRITEFIQKHLPASETH
jgi:hypothetical protein